MKHPKRHIHAESMLLYAQGSMDSEKEYMNWQVRKPGLSEWTTCWDIPTWHTYNEYRRKPPEPVWTVGLSQPIGVSYIFYLDNKQEFYINVGKVRDADAVVFALNYREESHE